jgi:hypothetical protein
MKKIGFKSMYTSDSMVPNPINSVPVDLETPTATNTVPTETRIKNMTREQVESALTRGIPFSLLMIEGG